MILTNSSILNHFIGIIILMMSVHKPTLMLYRRLLKTMMKTFDGDYEMFHRSRLDARKKIL